jgi:vanillate O-demethylase monooxygenase subunit
MGDLDRADESLIPDLSFIDECPKTARNQFYIPTAANYQLATDNIMDLTHADHIHPLTLGGVFEGSTGRVFKRDGRIVMEWVNSGIAAPGIFQPKVPSPATCDYWIEVAWEAPAVMVLATAVVHQGQPRLATDVIQALHSMTPETSTTTHYWACSTRRVRLDDQAFTDALREAVGHAFTGEDKPMLEAQQRRMGDADLWSLNPLILPGDAGGVQVRRELARRIAAEAGASRPLQEQEPIPA